MVGLLAQSRCLSATLNQILDISSNSTINSINQTLGTSAATPQNEFKLNTLKVALRIQPLTVSIKILVLVQLLPPHRMNLR